MAPILGTLASVLSLLIAVLPTTAYSVADPIPPHPPSPLAGLPTDVFHGQVVTLADGDRYEVSFAKRGQNVRGRRWDAATRTWGARRVIFEDADLRCWGLSARGSGNGVAVRVECGPAFDEHAEGRPHAIVSADTVTWESRRLSALPGYSRSAPGISPAGSQAVWSRGDEIYTWSAATGFVGIATTPPPEAYGEAPMITDDGTVTIAYTDDSCSVTFDRYLAPGLPTRQVVATPDGCFPDDVTSIDADTVAFGDVLDAWSIARLSRPDDAAPWVVSRFAPRSAPGLIEDHYKPLDVAPILLDAPDRPLAVVANGQDELHVQLYDPALQSWLAPSTLVERAGGTKCLVRDDFTDSLGFSSLSLRCAGPDRVVTSPDGGTWTAIPVGTQRVGPNGDVGLLAVPDRTTTVVLGKDTSTTLPVGTDGGCDVIVPIASDRLLRLTASTGSRGWPDRLQRSTAEGWKTVHRVKIPQHGQCGRVLHLGSGAGPRFGLLGLGRLDAMRVLFARVGGRWDVRVRAR